MVRSTAQSVRSLTVSEPPHRNPGYRSTPVGLEDIEEDDASTIRYAPKLADTLSISNSTRQTTRTRSISDTLMTRKLRPRRFSAPKEFNLVNNTIFERPFENELAHSPVYARIRGNECDVSFTTSQPMSGFWSMLSGLSLSQISNISVIALPISSGDIASISWYETEPKKVFITGPRYIFKIAILGLRKSGKSALTTRVCVRRLLVRRSSPFYSFASTIFMRRFKLT